MNYFDKLMYSYYKVLMNAWKSQLKVSARLAIQMLSDMPRAERLDDRKLNSLLDVIRVELGEDLAAAVNQDTKAFIERSLLLGLKDVKASPKASISIGLYGVEDAKLVRTIQQQNLFWIGNHFGTDIQSDFKKVMTQAIQEGFTKEMLANKLEQTFADLGDKGKYYWQGLAEHTALRIREFGRLSGYEKAGAKYYRLVNPMDDRTSDICRALVSQNKLYPLATALEVRDNLLSIDMNKEGLEGARELISAIAPWVKEKNIERDADGNPTGVSGAHTPFPPFHWKCRTETEIVE